MLSKLREHILLYPLAPVLACYTGLFLLLLPDYIYQVNPDAVSYVALAQHPADLATNTYWSPLLSWLLIPFLHLKLEPMLAIKLISFAAGALSINCLDKLGIALSMKNTPRLALLLFAAGLLLFHTLYGNTPDPLSVLIGLLLVYTLSRRPTVMNGIFIGLLWALAYYAKHYNLFAFALIIPAGLWLNEEAGARQKRTTALIAALCCALALGPWLWWQHQATGHVSLSSAGRINLAMLNPAHRGYPMLQPRQTIDAAQLHQFTYSIWEKPQLLTIYPWSPFNHPFYYLKNIIAHNILLCLATLLIPAVLVLAQYRKWKHNAPLRLLCIAAFIYAAGYVLLLTEVRYLVLPLLLLFFVLSALPLGKGWQLALYAALMISLWQPAYLLHHSRQSGKDAFETAAKLDSNTLICTTPGSWNRALAVAYYSKSKIAGVMSMEDFASAANAQATYFICDQKEIKKADQHAILFRSAGGLCVLRRDLLIKPDPATHY